MECKANDTYHLNYYQASLRELLSIFLALNKCLGGSITLQFGSHTISLSLSTLVCRAPMANTIAACVGSKDIQSQVACPCTVGRPVTENLVKFNRKQIQEALRWVGLLLVGKVSRLNGVLPFISFTYTVTHVYAFLTEFNFSNASCDFRTLSPKMP